jgi:hypothetical protein
MQKGIQPACFRPEVATEVTVAVIEQRMIFRMQKDDGERGCLESLERGTGPVFRPGVEEKLAGLVAGGREHWAEGGGRREEGKR